MAPRTRSANQRNPATAPVTRVYRRASPPPRQARFPARRKVIKTYGRRGISASSLRQQTMTQMAYLVPSQPDSQEDDSDNGDDAEAGTGEQHKVERPRSPKRRKTMGDAPSSPLSSLPSSFHTQTLTQIYPKTGDPECPIQISDSEEDNDEDEGEGDSEDGNESHLDVVSRARENPPVQKQMENASSLLPTVPRTPSTQRLVAVIPSSKLPQPSPNVHTLLRNISPLGSRRSPLQAKSGNASSIPPLTAGGGESKRKRPTPRDRVIPDSYSSAPSSSIGNCLATGPSSPSKKRSPLKELTPSRLPRRSPRQNRAARASVELENMENITPERQQRRDDTDRNVSRWTGREIPDSDDEICSLGPTPAKPVPEPLERISEEAWDSNSAPATPTPLPRTVPLPVDYDGEETASDPGSPTPLPRKISAGFPVADSKSEKESTSQLPESGSEETQTSLVSSPRTGIAASHHSDAEIGDSDSEAGSPSPLPRRIATPGPPSTGPKQDTAVRSQRSSKRLSKEDVAVSRPIGVPSMDKAAEPPPALHKKDVTQGGESTHLSSPVHNLSSPLHSHSRTTRTKTQSHTQIQTQAYTQSLESQRVPMEILREMAPQTVRSDVIITMHPTRVQEIVDGVRNHEFRNTRLLPSVSRVWIYVARPVCELKYMATIGEPKEPGQIDSSTGYGNAEFNERRGGGRNTKFAYELRQVYQLNNPVSLERMKENGWTEGNQRTKYLPPAVVGQLLANLRCALFEEHPGAEHKETDEDPGSVSQEIEAQIHSDVAHSTQLQADAAAIRGEGGSEVIPSSQKTPKAPAPSTVKPRVRFTAARPPVEASPPQSRSRNTRSQTQSQVQSQIRTRFQSQLKQQNTRSGQASTKAPIKLREKNMTSFSQATTASQPSTQIASPARREEAEEESLHRPPLGSSISIHEFAEGESPRHGNFSGESSQIYLPDSLLRDDVREPPIILDSEDEDSG